MRSSALDYYRLEKTQTPRDYVDALGLDGGPVGRPETGSGGMELLSGDFMGPVSFDCFLEFTVGA